jgi:hypothetical protein
MRVYEVEEGYDLYGLLLMSMYISFGIHVCLDFFFLMNNYIALGICAKIELQ